MNGQEIEVEMVEWRVKLEKIGFYVKKPVEISGRNQGDLICTKTSQTLLN
jgi:hypothetical protein